MTPSLRPGFERGLPIGLRLAHRVVGTSSCGANGPMGSLHPDALKVRNSQIVPAVAINQKIAVGVVFVSAMFMNIMDITIVNVALPTIGRDFNSPPTAVDGVVIAYLVSLAVFIPA